MNENQLTYSEIMKTVKINDIWLEVSNNVSYLDILIYSIQALVITKSMKISNAWVMYILCNGGSVPISFEMKTSEDALLLKNKLKDIINDFFASKNLQK